MRRVAAFVVFDIQGDPPLALLHEAVLAALDQIRFVTPKGQLKVLARRAAFIGYVSPDNEPPQPEPDMAQYINPMKGPKARQ